MNFKRFSSKKDYDQLPDEDPYGTDTPYGMDDIDDGNSMRPVNVAPAQNAGGKIALKLVRPESHTDAPKIANQLMAGSIVVLDIDTLEREAAVRLIDFLAGVNHVLGGQMIRTNRTTIVVAPNGVDIGDFGLGDGGASEENEDETEEEEDEI